MKKYKIVLALLSLFMVLSPTMIKATNETDDIIDAVSIIDNEYVSDEDKQAYYDTYKDFTQENDDLYDPELFSDEITDAEDEIIDDEIEETPKFRAFAAIEPHALDTSKNKALGYFTLRDIGTTANIYPTSTSNQAYTYIAANQYYTGMFPILKEENNRYLIVVAGVEGWIPKTGITVTTYNKDSTVNVYFRSEGKLYHRVYENSEKDTKNTKGLYYTFNNGPAPSYIKDNTNYYSFDGHYFYTDFNAMYNDYKAGNRNNALNSSSPFYNYYQFLSYRTESNINANDLAKFLNDNISAANKAKGSVITGKEQQFIDAGKDTATNPVLTFSMAILESAWGTSNYAKNRLNLFGHQAYDSNPNLASSYPTLYAGISAHTKHYVNYLYVDSAGSNYFGASVGDKSIGMNVKYSSDPYWGQKIAELSFDIDGYSGNKDYNKYTIGIFNDNNINVRNNPNTTGSESFYQGKKNYPVVILDEVEGQNISNNTKWYKIATDRLINNQGKPSDRSQKTYTELVDIKNNVGYAHSPYITKVAGKGVSTESPTYKKGDLNKDNVIDISDMMVIRRHILKVKVLTGNDFKEADLNNDGELDISDMMVIRRHILGIKPIS